VAVRLDDSTFRKTKAAAEAERTTISKFVEYATVAYIESGSVLTKTRVSSEGKELVTTLNKAMKDIKRGKYRIVR